MTFNCPTCSFKNGLSKNERIEMFNLVTQQMKKHTSVYCTLCGGRFGFKLNGALSAFSEKVY